MPRRGSILGSRSNRTTSSRSNGPSSGPNSQASISHQPIHHELHDCYNPAWNAHHTQQDYRRRDDYQSYEGFRFQDLLQTQEGFPPDHPYTFGGYNVDGGYYDWRGKDVRRGERVEEDRGEQYERVDSDNDEDEDEDEGDDVNARGLGDEGNDCNVRDLEDRDDIPSIHGSTSSPLHNEQRVQKQGFDTHKDPITKKRELRLYGTTDFNNSSCGREIGLILRSNFKGPWHNWEKVDSTYRDELFKEFKKKYIFSEDDEPIVRKIWEDKTRIALNQQLTRARKRAMSDRNTRNIMDCINKGPVWINNDDWNQMIKEIWSTPEFQRRSKSARNNRLTETDGKLSTHSGGTVSFASYRASMQEKAGGKEPLWDDVFSVLHQSAKKPETFIDNKSKKVFENYKKEMISRYGTDRENHPSFDGAAWCAAIGGVGKGRIYGAPGMPKSMVSTSASSQSYTMESTPPSSSIQALKEQIKERDGHILSLQQEMTSIKNFLSNMGYQAWASNMDQGMSTPMASSMPSHMAPQMYPLSNPVYRPRPRPPYTGPTS